MPKSYSDEQNQVFIDFMEDYRNLIEDKTEKETVILTKSFAIQLMKTLSILSDRNINGNGVAERLV